MKRLVVILVPLMLLALACDELATPQTPLPPELEATVRALVAETESVQQQQATGEPDTEATITVRVQATVQALMEATPIPSPTPTAIVFPTVASPTTTPPGPSISSTLPAPTATRVPIPTPSPTSQPTPSPTLPSSCSSAADGVEVSAWVNGALAASTLVESGRYDLLVEQSSGASFSGQIITFTVGRFDADQTTVWVQGGATELNLTAPDGPLSRLAPGGVGGPSVTGGPLAQPVLPHIILGTVSVGDC